MLRISVARALLDIAEPTVYQYEKEGRWTIKRISPRVVRIPTADVEALIGHPLSGDEIAAADPRGVVSEEVTA